MGNKYYLKTFNNKAEYESQKNSVMYTPHVVLLNDTEEVVYTSKNYFTITALDNGYLTLTAPAQDVNSFKYRKNKGNWEESNGEDVIEVKPCDTVQISCESNSFKYSNTNSLLSSSNVRFNVSGNIMSLIYGDNFIGQTTLKSASCFSYLLFNSNVVSAKNLILPATTLTNNCYQEMFSNCKILKEAPELPATKLAICCYMDMFFGCSSLTTAPVLPATTLTAGCYMNMFYGCTILTISPVLPATKLVVSCYQNMFNTCSKLTFITMLATDISANNCLLNWVENVASSGMICIDKSMTSSFPNGSSGLPLGWTKITPL